MGDLVNVIICARSGSKGIPGKNVKDLCGIPLVKRSAITALGAKRVESVWLSTDSQAILEIGRNSGCLDLGLRGAHLSGDKIRQVEVVRSFFELMEEKLGRSAVSKHWILQQTTSPFLLTKDIDNAVEMYFKNKCKHSVISGYSIDQVLSSIYLENENMVAPAISNLNGRQRQSQHRLFVNNGAIRVFNRERFCSTRKFETDPAIPYFMPQERSINLDEVRDWQQAERLLSDGFGQK